MTKKTTGPDTSSAELTAHYRCAFSNLSHDQLSYQLGPDTHARAFIEKYDYTLAPRKISVLAGFFLEQATELLNTGRYDSVISFASGFSMLTYLIAERQTARANIQYIDSDLPDMIAERKQRIEAAFADGKLNQADKTVYEKISVMAFNIEQAYQAGKPLKDIFPNCLRPIFILDGVSYFLTPSCMDWLLTEISGYEEAAILLYYWPDDMVKTSSLFAKVFADLKQGKDFREELIGFWTQENREKFAGLFPTAADLSLTEVEELVCRANQDTKRLLTDSNDHFPVRVVSGQTSPP